MSRRSPQDQHHLLDESASIPPTPITPESIRFDDPYEGFLLRDIETSDIGTQRSPQYPSSYSSGWDKDPEIGEGKSSGLFEEHIRRVPNRSTTFGTFTSKTRPAVKNGFHRFLRFLLQSGSYASHISYERASEGTAGIPAKYSGWRGGVFLGATSAGTVFLINLIFTIWAGAKTKSGIRVGTLYEGECSTVHKADSWVHIAINVMGTLLLGASNYAMQCLSSPTRNEIDAAHAMGKFMDVGLPSFRNLHGWKKKILFTMLVLSTLPLHFLWNSAVFTTTQRLDYNVYVVTPDFLTVSPVDCTQNVTIGYDDTGRSPKDYNRAKPLNATILDQTTYKMAPDPTWWLSEMCNTSQALHANASKNQLTRLDNVACINAYGPGTGMMKGHSNLLVVTKEKPPETNNTVLMAFRAEAFVSNWTANRWVCDPDYLAGHKNQCNYKELAKEADKWSLARLETPKDVRWEFQLGDQWSIDYCLAEPTELSGMCQLQYSLVIMIAVLCANAVKLFCIVYILTTHMDTVLATIGDAIASFLEVPDPVTAGRPFLTRGQARDFKKASGIATPYHPAKLRWWQAPSVSRWIITLIFCILAISITGYLLTYGNESFMGAAQGNFDTPYDLGFGSYSQYATLNIFSISQSSLTAQDFDSNSILIAMVTVANLPQVIVSCLYFAYNTIYTSMVSADEWSRFTRHRKALRTTEPRGEQRSTYWLSLPWTYALPLAVASSVLHWLISQSLFVSRTEVLDARGEPEPLSYMNVGYNPLAILLALLFGVSMVLAMILNGFKKLAEGSTLVGNNSLAISAACQRDGLDEGDWDVGAEKKRVMWGAVRHEIHGVPGHCCFSSGHVERPRIGDKYL
ncbi:hypothetical protein VTL71DRAFT_3788 [Oculimacula yallundae]|uniref:DUF6536 domain-containing protein n=1 Tax=Oculimacula yallundae TaxID=86028 RepID=A0ABR4C3Z1_9HELO